MTDHPTTQIGNYAYFDEAAPIPKDAWDRLQFIAIDPARPKSDETVMWLSRDGVTTFPNDAGRDMVLTFDDYVDPRSLRRLSERELARVRDMLAERVVAFTDASIARALLYGTALSPPPAPRRGCNTIIDMGTFT